MSASKGHAGDVRNEQFDIDLVAKGFDSPGIPNRADVQLNGYNNDSYVAIVEAGSAGRWSVDFAVDGSNVEFTRAYQEGMRVGVGDLPNWMEPIRLSIEGQLLE